MRKALTTIAAAALLLGSVPAAAETSAQMNVSVRVIPRAVLTVDAPTEFEVTAADVARGYVEVAPIQIRLRTNSLNGSLLQALKTSEAFSSVDVVFGHTTMSVAHEGWVVRPYTKGGEVMTVNLRARLAPGTSAGLYALPVHFSASAM